MEKTHLLLLVVLIVFAGCRTIVIHPIETIDIQVMKKGVAFTPQKDGFFLSNEYIKEVVDAKVKR